MTRHTTDFLCQRTSNLSLRGEAATNTLSTSRFSSFANPSEFENESTISDAVKAFVVGDLARRGSVTLCDSCLRNIPKEKRAGTNIIVESDAQKCSACNILASKPEAFTEPFCKFLRENPTVFHSVGYFKDKLNALGYKELPARDDWSGKLKAGGKYFVTRNGSSIIGFTVGKAYKPGNGVAMIAGHIDAITAKLKPVSNKPTKAGYVQLGVAPYAGGLNETWWDRDLSIGGRVIVRDESGKTSSRLVQLDWPIARIPTLAPHFGVGMLGQQNKETEAVPIIGLDNSDISSSNAKPVEPLGPAGSFVATQPPRLVQLISQQLGIKDHSQIVNWELELFDLQPATVGGLDKEFIFAGRIDDKLCSWAAFQALLASEANDDDGVIKLVALFDDEEIGSLLRQGARGNFLPSVIERAVESLCGEDKAFGPGVIGRTYAQSFLVSADVSHAVNPNFLSRYLDGHAPRLNVGITIAADSNGHMTTDSVSTAILTRVAELSDCTPQVFQIRNDSRSGGTVGPMLSSAMGVKAADAGMAQLSMHSIRATCGSLDPGLGVKFFKGFLDKWEKVDAEWQ
ncbi:aminopeptidase I zinc metalloprotease-domain-containing protein [Daldinia caldariorum]|uniref:aminopeptidase I zinc metalloprotease-domain-containing protein n=1 Tax=Daldinia caldariorum TaxID=326644 RepID=UPI002007FC3B|nr:aminopeptidase I zinc metalloprotease-domain-containing protein [Daldinia caldariorum]KAI1470020.1 aminopeptidase I zinc metalloprotease-domain-containing protein [Daldinia caldariorum]